MKVVKNGLKKTGKQNLLCKDCGKQFQPEYRYLGADQRNKKLIIKMLLRGSGVRDCAIVAGVSTGVVLRIILIEGAKAEIRPKYRSYHKVQIDEQWSYVGKKQKKVWMIYAICAESSEILAASWGRRNKTNVKRLLSKLGKLQINFFCTDEWVSFTEVLPAQKHIIGKAHTKKIEGLNTWFRTRLRRLARRTVCFSKKLLYHFLMMKIAIVNRNNRPSYI